MQHNVNVHTVPSCGSGTLWSITVITSSLGRKEARESVAFQTEMPHVYFHLTMLA